MTRYLSGYIALMAALLLASCASDTPTQAGDNVDDIAVAMVQGTIGHQSNGFAAVIEDAARLAANEQTATNAPVAAAMKPVMFVQHGSLSDLYSEWQMAYSVDHISSTIIIKAASEGVSRTSDSRMQGSASGKFTIGTKEAATSLINVSGSYEYNGSAMFTGKEEQYPAVAITCNWNRLLVDRTTGTYRIFGQADVSISATGTQGTISKNARLIFNGTDHAIVSIGGRQSRVQLGERLSSIEQ